MFIPLSFKYFYFYLSILPLSLSLSLSLYLKVCQLAKIAILNSFTPIGRNHPCCLDTDLDENEAKTQRENVLNQILMLLNADISK